MTDHLRLPATLALGLFLTAVSLPASADHRGRGADGWREPAGRHDGRGHARLRARGHHGVHRHHGWRDRGWRHGSRGRACSPSSRRGHARHGLEAHLSRPLHLLSFVLRVVDGHRFRHYDCGCRTTWRPAHHEFVPHRVFRHGGWRSVERRVFVPAGWHAVDSCGRH